MIRRHKLKTCHNMRDIGGYQGDGFVTGFNVFIRSDDVSLCTEKEVEYVRGIGVKTVIDLRGKEEVRQMPNIFGKSSGINYYNIPLMREERFGDILKPFTLEDLYVDIIENKKAIKSLFDTIAQNLSGAVLYHCTAGKDRTGITTCLLLMLAGVDRYDITADYEVSHTYLTEKRREFQEKYPDVSQHVHRSHPELILSVYEHIIQNYGSVAEYLLDVGVSQENLDRIKNKLTTKGEW